MDIDYWAVESFLVGECGMSQRQAALTSLEEYVQRRNGKDREMQDRWEIARWQMWHHLKLSPNVQPFNKPSTPQGFCRFPWEKDTIDTIVAQDCHIDTDTLDWLNRQRERYNERYSKVN